MKTVPISLQLWSVRDEVKADFARAVDEVAKIGFAAVETAGYGNLDANGAAKAIADAGLKCSGMHVGLGALRADLTKVAAEAHLFDTTNVICPSFPRTLLKSTAAFVAAGEELDALGARLRAFGITLHYHNHDFEMARFDGRLGLDSLLDAARPSNLLCEADVYWLHHGGKDPAAFILEQGRRIRLLHIKDESEIGSGPVDFPSVFAAADAVGAAEWYVIEVEQYNHAPLESVRRSHAQLSAWMSA